TACPRPDRACPIATAFTWRNALACQELTTGLQKFLEEGWSAMTCTEWCSSSCADKENCAHASRQWALPSPELGLYAAEPAAGFDVYGPHRLRYWCRFCRLPNPRGRSGGPIRGVNLANGE